MYLSNLFWPCRHSLPSGAIETLKYTQCSLQYGESSSPLLGLSSAFSCYDVNNA